MLNTTRKLSSIIFQTWYVYSEIQSQLVYPQNTKNMMESQCGAVLIHSYIKIEHNMNEYMNRTSANHISTLHMTRCDETSSNKQQMTTSHIVY